ncbi:MBL fold metallo-hydrolase, partial [Shewanella sp. 11B5]
MKLTFQRHIIGLSALAMLALAQTSAIADDKFS